MSATPSEDGRSNRPDPFAVIDPDRTLGERLFLAWDLIIVVLVSVNLTLIIFDTIYVVPGVDSAFGAVWSAGHDWYVAHIHKHLMAIDLAFVAVFVLDVLAGWALAIAQKRFQRWYFYPFVRWYDVLGCIPVAGFRFLRVLRLISVAMRLQRLGVIDVRNWWIYRQFMVYWDIVVEEISDRVVLRVLSGVQEELESGSQQLTRQVLNEVIAPRRHRLSLAASTQIEYAVVAAYQANRDQIQAYAANVAERAIDANPALHNLERLPMVGAYVSDAIDDAIRDTVNQVLDEAISGLSSAEFDALVANIVESAIERLTDQDIGNASSEIRDATIEILDLVKQQVAVQRWREHFD